MCGITGFWEFKQNRSNAELSALAGFMAAEIKARGPDSFGTWSDETIGLAFGHRRLSIVDLSEAGHQPMLSHSTRSVLSYNGEIYNAAELRVELMKAGCTFRGYSDTEVILEACEHWGVHEACQRFIGMFAFSLWDKQQQKLFLVRDRLGIKPLYWGFNQNVLFFASQLKSFSPFPTWQPTLDQNILSSYFRFNYVPAPYSIFKGIYKQQPGTVITIDKNRQIQETRFWDFNEIAKEGLLRRAKQNISDSEYVEALDTLLRDAVKRRMIADVPLGAFLSGGIDSSTVVALMQAQSTRPIRTFSIGFNESEYNEAPFAAEVAKHLGTDHTELYLEPKAAQTIIPTIPNWCDEPFADVSQIPTFLVSQLAVGSVKVSLSGDGGDELFAGYSRYFVGNALWQKIKFLPFWLRCLGAYGIRRLPPSRWDSLAQMIPYRVRPRLMGDKAYKLADILTAKNSQVFYQSLVSHWDAPSALIAGSTEPLLHPWNEDLFSKGHFVDVMQRMDTRTYLPDDILAKVDRASMAVSLEARVPLLDHRVVEFAWGLPLELKIRAGQGKWILRQVLNKYVPHALMDRPKMGFGVPVDTWLRGDLREWAEGLLSADRLRREGILNPEPILQRWKEHLSGQRNWQYSLWGVLMFQAWKEKWSR